MLCGGWRRVAKFILSIQEESQRCTGSRERSTPSHRNAQQPLRTQEDNSWWFVGSDLAKLFPAKSFALHRQKASLIIGEQHEMASNLIAKHLVLRLKVFGDHFLLLACLLDEYGNEHMQLLEKK